MELNVFSKLYWKIVKPYYGKKPYGDFASDIACVINMYQPIGGYLNSSRYC